MSTNGDCIFATATDDPVTSINTLVTAYYGLAGSLDTSQSTEANAQVTVNNTFKFSELTCNVTSNSITNTTTINLRANAGNTDVALSVDANTTGIFTDNTHTYTAAATDAMTICLSHQIKFGLTSPPKVSNGGHFTTPLIALMISGRHRTDVDMSWPLSQQA
jgi:7-cyano-7-deazaguanine synthase in queuosine biosynthesis